jgi:SAM-dependent methyltransferase
LTGSAGSRSTWNDAYSADGPPLARSPYAFVASFLFRFGPPGRSAADTTVLELGFGSGANLAFAAHQGFQVSGVDVSDIAVEAAHALFAREGLTGDLRRGEFFPLPFDDATFDLAFDRAAMTYVEKPLAAEAIAEVRRVLKPGGRFLFNPYSVSDSAAGDPDPASATRTPWAHGRPCFYSRADIERAALQRFTALEMIHVESINELLPERPCRAEWRVVLEPTA